jgi:hypothetical protein
LHVTQGSVFGKILIRSYFCGPASAKGSRAHGRSQPKASEMQDVFLACQVHTVLREFIQGCVQRPPYHERKMSIMVKPPQSPDPPALSEEIRRKGRGCQTRFGLDNTCPRNLDLPWPAAFVACVRQQLLTFSVFVMRHAQESSIH